MSAARGCSGRQCCQNSSVIRRTRVTWSSTSHPSGSVARSATRRTGDGGCRQRRGLIVRAEAEQPGTVAGVARMLGDQPCQRVGTGVRAPALRRCRSSARTTSARGTRSCAISLAEVRLVSVCGAEAGLQEAAGTVSGAEHHGGLRGRQQRAPRGLRGRTHGVGVHAGREHGSHFAEREGTDEDQLVAHAASASTRGIPAFATSLEDERRRVGGRAAAARDRLERLVVLVPQLARRGGRSWCARRTFPGR